MTSLTIELSPEEYTQLEAQAAQQGKAAASLAKEWVANQLEVEQPPTLSSRDRARQILKAAGMLSELPPELRRSPDPSISLDDIVAALGRDGKPLSEIVIEQRGPKF
jgi:hypothetical protein